MIMKRLMKNIKIIAKFENTYIFFICVCVPVVPMKRCGPRVTLYLAHTRTELRLLISQRDIFDILKFNMEHYINFKLSYSFFWDTWRSNKGKFVSLK